MELRRTREGNTNVKGKIQGDLVETKESISENKTPPKTFCEKTG